MKKVCFSVFFVLAVLALSLPVFAQSEYTEPVFTLLTPSEGQVLKGGRHVTVAWDLVVDKTVLENPWAELELYLADDHGMFARITPELGIRTRSFDWLVPAVNMQSAHLVLQFGIQGNGDLYHLSQTGTFSIRTKAGAGIGIELPTQARAGEDLDIRWTSNLDSSYVFDVMISYDRGAHFFRAGTTGESRYLFPVDEDFSGSITVKIVGRGADGHRVSSLLTRDATILIRETNQ